MCQTVTGQNVELEEQAAYKVVGDLISQDAGRLGRFLALEGPFHHTVFKRDGWSRSVRPRKNRWGRTSAGYHVFLTRDDAELYMDRHCYMFPSGHLKVIKVKIKGEAIPFKGGYAVQYWRPADPQEA